MASMREEARWYLQEARDGIAWLIVSKRGRGWEITSIYPDVLDDTGRIAIAEDDMDYVWRALRIDPNSVLLNSYYHNLGDTECMTLQSLCDAIRWQYKLGYNLLSDQIPLAE